MSLARHFAARTASWSRAFSSAPASRRLGFIGLGNMGGHMAHNLLKAGHDVVVFDVSQDALDTAVSRGATQASSPAEVARQSDVVITMLPSNPHVRSVYEGPDGVLSGVSAKTLLIDSSTIEPDVARQVAQSASAAGARLVDAPVSGGVGGAQAGTLTFMVGGSDDEFSQAKAVLEPMAGNIVHCGDIGTGQVAKVCNNLILGISMLGVAEAMNLGVKLGADPKKLAGIINTSSGRCWSSDTYNPCPGVIEGVPSSNDFNGGFGVDLMKKDLDLARGAAEGVKTPLPMGNMAHQLYQLMSSQGLGGKDFGVAFKWLADDQNSK